MSTTSVENRPQDNIQDNTRESRGSVPKYAGKTVIAVVICAGALLAGIGVQRSAPERAKQAKQTTPVASQAVQPSSNQVEDFSHEMTDQEKKATEETREKKLKEQFGEDAHVVDKDGNVAVVPDSKPSVGAARTSSSTAPVDDLERDRRKREYLSAFASNVAFSRRDASSSMGHENQSQQGVATKSNFAPQIPIQPQAERAAANDTATAAQISHTSSTARLQSPPDGTYILFEGSVLEAVLINRLNGDFTGPVLCMVTTNVYDLDRQHILIPQGSKIVGEAKKVDVVGQQRLSIAFHRLIRPDGASVDLNQFKGMNQIGETGLKDQVNNHYARIFGTSLALGVVSGLAAGSSNAGTNSSGADVYRQGVATSVSQSSTRILDKFLNILPTITIREGARVKVWLASDLYLPPYTLNQ